MKYEAVEAQPIQSSYKLIDGDKNAKFQINTKINPIGNDKMEILRLQPCLDNEGMCVWFEIPASETGNIQQYADKYAQEWVNEYFNK